MQHVQQHPDYRPENPVNLTENSIISFTPDAGWEATFTTETETWTEPVIGWAVVLDLIVKGGREETGLEPVLLVENRFPATLYWHLQDMSDPKPRVQIKRRQE